MTAPPVVQEFYDDALVLPLNLIQDDGVEQFVFLAEGDKAIRKPVTVKALSGSEVFVDGNIVPGDLLIVRGHNDVQDGSSLDIVD